MSHFRIFARRLFKRPVLLTLALVMAFLSAGGLGAGLLTLAPTLKLILGEPDGSLQMLARSDAPWLGESLLQSLPTDRFTSVVWLIAILIVLTIIGATAQFLHAATAYRLSVEAIGDVRRDLFRHALHLPLRTFAGRTSDVVSRLMNDTEVLLGGYLALTSKILADVTKGAASIAVAFYFDWRLALIAMVVAPLVYIIIRKLGKRVRRASRGAMRARSELLNVATEALQGARVVKVFSAERRELNRFGKHNADAVREQTRSYTVRAFATPLLEAVMITFLGLLVIPASKAIIDGHMNLEEFILTIAALGIGAASLKPLTRAVQEIQVAEAAATRLLELLNETPEPMWWRRNHAGRAPRLPRHVESVAFEEVSLTYPGAEEPALNGVTLRIPHGSTYAFVGPNGSGKTTLLSLVPRLFEPDRGRVLVDGRDIATSDLRSLRRQIAVVTQETVIFRGAIATNIAYGRRSAAHQPTREEIEHAARQARAHEFITRLPGGYDAMVGEQGSTLSGGQRQRLAIARAILRDPAILILDEATSMIDADSEHKIAEALAEFSEGRTCLIVAHRLSTVVNADQIVVMDRGRIVATGTHDELLQTSPLYETLARTQLVAAGV